MTENNPTTLRKHPANELDSFIERVEHYMRANYQEAPADEPQHVEAEILSDCVTARKALEDLTDPAFPNTVFTATRRQAP